MSVVRCPSPSSSVSCLPSTGLLSPGLLVLVFRLLSPVSWSPGLLVSWSRLSDQQQRHDRQQQPGRRPRRRSRGRRSGSRRRRRAAAPNSAGSPPATRLPTPARPILIAAFALNRWSRNSASLWRIMKGGALTWNSTAAAPPRPLASSSGGRGGPQREQQHARRLERRARQQRPAAGRCVCKPPDRQAQDRRCGERDGVQQAQKRARKAERADRQVEKQPRDRQAGWSAARRGARYSRAVRLRCRQRPR